MSDPFARPHPTDTAELHVLWADGRRERVELDAARELSVGRALDADVLVDREGVDRHHVRIAHRDGGWWLLGGGATTSGTWLSGRFVLEPRRLVDGDVVQLGGAHDVVLRFVLPHARVEAAPPRFDEGIVVHARDAAARGLPAVGLRMRGLPGFHVSVLPDAHAWLRFSAPPGGGPHGAVMRGPVVSSWDDEAAIRRLQQHVAPRAQPEHVHAGRVLALGGSRNAIAWVWGESLGRTATVVISAPVGGSEAMLVVFSQRAGPGPLEPWMVLTDPTLAVLREGSVGA
jgi:hypothetical protein